VLQECYIGVVKVLPEQSAECGDGIAFSSVLFFLYLLDAPRSSSVS
jgi:hypothetical protein